ncbi:ribonuclease R [Rhodanobacter denitrificans]|uniref:Ribonuclease R n=2 Tax=Gammaproteobacteria TaxID=1236 RepID=M4NGE8_9GAMM|nr:MULTISPECIES: ribonuclease R [Rhodanobacter]AGG88733.1 RNAse R [Rhodanobacter denitrificans]UJJ52608.1 ribonuclease R [Rhodanobacter denitrificans]UJJ58599.1 ribonuclease R [Rhodanobacter denitrificans]UJM87866.1 ribonuclease R [Rhodanobacter denitrificans]UJM89066.1 ribonuclease R [Rhodanobacter denitrificans]
MTRKTPPHSGNSQDSRSAKKPAKRAPRAAAAPDKRNKAAAGAVRDPHADREAQRYARPIPSREAILALLEERGELLTEARIAEALDIHDETDLEALRKRLAAMVRDGQLLLGRRGGYAPTQKLDLIAGVVLANAEGYGFLRPDEGGDDLYLSPQQMRAVMHGDRVLASVVGIDRRGRRQGAIAEVLQRRSPRLVGRVVIDDGVTLVTPDDRRLNQDVMIKPGRELGARSGQIVVAEITDPPTLQRGPIGEIRAVLGERLQPSLVVEMAIASHDLPHDWPAEVLRDAAQVESTVTAAEREGRTDLRKLPLVTIDGADARDFDDAVYAEPRRGGGWRLIVAIADVSHYVQVGNALDREAFERSTSTYFPGFVVPMLPETLSNGICSLNPKVERLCMVCDMQVDAEGSVVKSRFYDAVMLSHARLTYDKVWQAVGLREQDARHEVADVLPQLEHLHALYKAMAGQRRRRGAIDFETPEVKFRLDQTGGVESMGATERNDAHKLIEECMIAANVQAALFLEKKKIPALFRAHEPPPAEKYEDLQQFLREFKLRMPPVDEVTPGDFSEILRMVHDRPERELIQSVLLRSQSMAAYQPDNRGHFGLSLQAYAHFTSPIRRYPDLLVHRAIRHALTGRKPADYAYTPAEMAAMAVHCSQRERRAEEAERDVDERFKCAWMEKHIGSEFDGVVTGVTSFGLFVELDESKVSGLVHISQLMNDYYHFDATRKLLKGERTGAQFRLGDHVRIQVLRASLEDRKIDFRLVSPRTSAPAPTGSGKAYDYAAAGERYSLPKKAAATTKAPGMFGRAAKAIGRAFGRKEVEVAAPAPAPRKAAVSDNPPPRAQPAAARQHAGGQHQGRRVESSSDRRPRKEGSARRGPAPAATSPAPKKHGGRKPKPKGKP